jgi:hypothetical protein
VLVAAVFLNPLFVVLGAVTLVLAFNLWACRWIDREWEGRIAGERGRKIEKTLAKMRKGSFMSHPVRWGRSGSSWLFAVGATIINPALGTVVARMLGGQRVGERKSSSHRSPTRSSSRSSGRRSAAESVKVPPR